MNGAIDAGSFRAWRDQFLAAFDGGGEADVPCGKCTACCRSAYFIDIAPDERETIARIPAALLVPAPGRPKGHLVMGFDTEGRCPMLGDGGCTIYEHRPRTCRAFDCRVFAATGIVPEDKPLIAERVNAWEFDHPTDDDRAAHLAVRAAAVWVREQAESSGRNATDIAVEALRV